MKLSFVARRNFTQDNAFTFFVASLCISQGTRTIKDHDSIYVTVVHLGGEEILDLAIIKAVQSIWQG